MSLFALDKSQQKAKINQQQIEEFLAGNLCRCTGYKAIIEAAMKVMQATNDDQFNVKQSKTIAHLQKIEPCRKTSQPDKSEQFLIPQTTEQLCQYIDQFPDARLLAGGTDLVLEVTQQLKSLQKIIYLGQIDELNHVTEKESFFEVGSMMTLDQFDTLNKQHYPAMSGLLERFRSKQICHVGTIGGNIANASPIGDSPPVLIALNAELMLQSSSEIRKVDLEDFFIDYKKTYLKQNELIHSVTIPKLAVSQQLKIYKVSKRMHDDISAVCMACVIEVEKQIIKSIRIAFGGMAAIPKRAKLCEIALSGQSFNEDNFRQAQYRYWHRSFRLLMMFVPVPRID